METERGQLGRKGGAKQGDLAEVTTNLLNIQGPLKLKKIAMRKRREESHVDEVVVLCCDQGIKGGSSWGYVMSA